MSLRFILTKLNVWKIVNPHLTLCIVPPLERFSLDFNYQRHYEIFEVKVCCRYKNHVFL